MIPRVQYSIVIWDTITWYTLIHSVFAYINFKVIYMCKFRESFVNNIVVANFFSCIFQKDFTAIICGFVGTVDQSGRLRSVPMSQIILKNVVDSPNKWKEIDPVVVSKSQPLGWNLIRPFSIIRLKKIIIRRLFSKLSPIFNVESCSNVRYIYSTIKSEFVFITVIANVNDYSRVLKLGDITGCFERL